MRVQPFVSRVGHLWRSCHIPLKQGTWRHIKIKVALLKTEETAGLFKLSYGIFPLNAGGSDLNKYKEELITLSIKHF